MMQKISFFKKIGFKNIRIPLMKNLLILIIFGKDITEKIGKYYINC